MNSSGAPTSENPLPDELLGLGSLLYLRIEGVLRRLKADISERERLRRWRGRRGVRGDDSPRAELA